MNPISRWLKGIRRTVALALPRPRDIKNEVVHDLEMGAEFIDPARADVRYVGPEPRPISVEREPDRDEPKSHERS
jgi:hypothetical protein